MLKIWFIILVTVGSDGTVHSDLRYPLKPEFNTEKQCNEVGQVLADQTQTSVGTDNAKVFFLCSPVDLNDLRKLDPGI